MAIVVAAVVAVVVAVAVAIVLVAVVVVVVKSCPEMVNTNWGPYLASRLVNTI